MESGKKKPVAAKKAVGRAKGGVARAASLSDSKRKEIAKKAAIARWGQKPPEATHKGSFKDEFGIDVDCYVLNDAQKTAVISQRGMGLALGLKDTSGQAFPRFAQGKVIAQTLGVDLLENISNPLIFKDPTAVVSAPEHKVHGYDVTVLIDVCKAVVKAEADGKLLSSQTHIAKQAHVILNASAKAGIKGLVYALSGYDATREEIITAFKLYVQQEAKEYEKEFPPQLYNEWYKLYQLPKFERGRPWEFKKLTLAHVYSPLARSNGKLLELIQVNKAKSGDRTKKLHQFLSEIGTRALRTHLGQLLGIARISKSKAEYERHVRTLFGDQREFDFDKE
ncbi:P63C domain-containing protein [Paraburkholderia sp. BL27I4N3]|uniref:P63C domain-containing protein n=1 Tax=Paraburkholderia sp. BL27I4N3 TaxID=1938805 RepID=UPI000E25FC7C|nr:P63C domain-containing protein [Paraburkholderia sp. BL27I4N3]REE17962.1 P63C domain-containing protein [Paraburkholderia sp. BL27I4N3]